MKPLALKVKTTKIETSSFAMVLVLDGNSEIGARVRGYVLFDLN